MANISDLDNIFNQYKSGEVELNPGQERLLATHYFRSKSALETIKRGLHIRPRLYFGYTQEQQMQRKKLINEMGTTVEIFQDLLFRQCEPENDLEINDASIRRHILKIYAHRP